LGHWKVDEFIVRICMRYPLFIIGRLTNKSRPAYSSVSMRVIYNTKFNRNPPFYFTVDIHSVQQKSSGPIFRTSRSGSDVTFICHPNSNRFTFPVFVHSWRFSVSHSLHHAAYILTRDTKTFA